MFMCEFLRLDFIPALNGDDFHPFDELRPFREQFADHPRPDDSHFDHSATCLSSFSVPSRQASVNRKSNEKEDKNKANR